MNGLLPEVRTGRDYYVPGRMNAASMARFRAFCFSSSGFLLLFFFFGTRETSAQNFLMSNSTVSTCAGNFYDSGGGLGQYNNNEDYEMTFCSGTTGQCIQMVFSAFVLENGNDTLYAFNGPNTASTLIGAYTGSTFPTTLTGTTGCLTFRFKSNSTNRRSGWAATISCINCSAGPCHTVCTGTPPDNDDCSGAQDLGTLPLPGPCLANGLGGVAPWVSINSGNVCATAEFPYSAMIGCQPTGQDSMAIPASDVWYRFTIPNPTLNVRITGMQEPNVGLYKGADCNSLTPLGCAVGNNGLLNATFGGLPVGVYYLQVSGGSLVDQCNFVLELQNNYDCAGCVIQSSLVANPPPVNGTYLAGQRVDFCYTITDYNQTSNNWLHGVVPSFGPGWDMSTLTTTGAQDCPVLSAAGVWSWYNGTITSSETGLSAGPGFFFETSAGGPSSVADNDPGNNYGDYNALNACDWTFCWSITTLPPAQCVPGAKLNIDVDTYGDGETGSWGSNACTQDAITHFFAALACCEPPQITNPLIPCNGTSTTVTANGQGIGPWTYIWKNAAGTVLQTSSNVNGSNTFSNAVPGNYSVTVVDNANCSSQNNFIVAAPPTVAVNLTPTDISCFGNADGRVTAVVIGGQPGYTFAWTPSGGSSATATGLSQGTYTVTVTDAAGCTTSSSASVAQPAALAPSITANIPVTCNSLNNGSATVTAGGGTPGYSYAWNPAGGTSATASNLAAGNYSVTVTDSRGCSQSTNVMISQPPVLAVNIAASAPVLCNGGNDGSATASANGGSPGYSYAWTPFGGNAVSASNLPFGNYTVTVTDANGCTSSTSVAIAQPSPLTANITATVPVNCFGDADGSATVSAGGGTPGYSYAWNPSGGNAATASNLASGNYSVTVTDNQGCSAVANVAINQPAQLLVNMPSVTPVNCFGGNNGSATSSANGGTPGYSYSWSPAGGTASGATNLSAGVYTVTVTDAAGCQANAVAAVNQPAQALTYNSAILALPTCGNANGSASVSPQGGTPPYAYQWLPSGGTAAVATGLAAGPYAVNITDANGCTQQANIALASIAGPGLSVISTSDASCFGQANGSATVSAGNGTPGYSFAWLPSGGNAATASNLVAGNYSVTVTDANNCQATTLVTIGQPALLAAAISGLTPVSCNNGNDGTAQVAVAGGVPGYSYAWNPAVGGSTSLATNLPAGNYSVTVTDNNGCTATASTTISQPAALNPAITLITDASCSGGSDGAITASAAGGTPGYSYAWLPTGGNAATAANLPAGNYSLTITDANGCMATIPATVSQPNNLVGNLTAKNDASCNGSSDGSASVSVNGGMPGYSYAWNPSGGNSATANNLPAGNYVVTITDNNGCSTLVNAVINQPTPLAVQVPASGGVSCNGGNDGSAMAVALGGTPGYGYAWTPAGGSSATAASLPAGNYTVTVTDAGGCTASSSVTILQPPALAVAITSSVPAGCNGGNDGSLTVTAGGGTPGYSYAWNPSGGSNATAGQLAAGNYLVTVTDNNGCTQTANGSVNQPAPLVAGISGNSAVRCFGGNDGSAAVTAGGGTSPYTYAWLPSGGNSSSAINLSQGNYSVTVTDAHGCSANAATTIAQPTQLIAGISTQSNALCFGGNTGAASIAVNGGTPVYSYAWNPPAAGGNVPSASGLGAGNYVVTVSDANGCNAQVNVVIGQPPVLNATIVSPVHVSCFGGNNGSATVSANGGSPGYSYAWLPASAGTASGASGLTAGAYDVTVTDANGCTANASVNIGQPALLAAAISSFTDVNCFGGNDGSATATANGGSAPYQYAWNPSGGSSAVAGNLSTGNYSVTVTDNHGCTATAQASINQPLQLTAGLITTDALCGSANGTATVTPAGGIGPYSYSWSAGAGPGAISTNLAAANYSVTVTDAHNCSWNGVASISSIGGPVASAQVVNDVSCKNGNDGSVTVNIANGTGPFTYAWLPTGGASPTATNLPAGNYSVTITDAHGCLSTDNVAVQEPGLLQAQVTPVAASCFGGSNGTGQAQVSGGTTPYSYNWSSGGTGSSVSGLASGNYFVNVTDAHGCTAAANFTVAQPTPLNVAANPSPASCFGGSNGSAVAQGAGGTPGYAYQWFPSGATTANATGLSAGIHTVTITDSKGCTAQAMAQVNQPDALNPLITSSANVSCYGGTNGMATVSTTGGTAGYQYQWNPSGGTNATALNLTAGNYTVHITDAQGCTGNATVLISQPIALVTAIPSHSDARCFGAADGGASVTAQGGTPGYLYSWSPVGGTGASAIGLAFGNYSVTVTDAQGCTSTSSVQIGQPTPLAANAVQLNAVSCFNGNNGSASVNAAGGTGPYSYVWNPAGGTASVASGLTAQNYTVSIQDNHGCQSNAAVLISQPPPMNLAVGSLPSTCNASNGSASAAVAGGTGPYSWLWSTGNTSANLPAVSAGNYQVTVTDANGCTISDIANVQNINGPAASAQAVQHVSCFGGANGNANVQVNSGTPPFQYAWSPAGGTGISASGLTAGTYTVTVTDDKGCISVDQVAINQPAVLQSSVAVTNARCFGSADGEVNASANGGTLPYAYAWLPGGNTQAIVSGLPAGNYSVTITDAHGCSSTTAAQIQQPLPVSLVVQSTPVDCNGSSTGSASAKVAGGTAPYSYAWSNGATTATLPAVAAGRYTVSVNDAHSCPAVDSADVIQPPQLVVQPSVVPSTCGFPNGSAQVLATGGVGAFTYAWSAGSSTSPTLQNISGGNYTATVTDGNGCIVQSVAVVPSIPPPVVAASMSQRVSCHNGHDGSVASVVSSGTAPFTYQWSGSAGTASTATNLGAGVYTLTVTDSNGCVVIDTALVRQPQPIGLFTNTTAAACNSATGSANVLAQGGNGSYTYLWTSSSSTTSSATGLVPGLYSVTVTDFKGCNASATMTVQNINGPVPAIQSSNNVSCYGGNNGSASVNLSGGTAPFQYAWSPSGGTSASASGLEAGLYSVMITDALGCQGITTVTIDQPLDLALVMASTPSSCGGLPDGTATVAVTGGTSPYQYLWSNSSSLNSISGLLPGNYNVAVTDNHGCTRSSQVIVTTPTNFTSTISSTDVVCFGQANGSVSVTPTGGTPPYNYLWSPGGRTSSSISNLGPGIYTATITDAAGCQSQMRDTVSQPPQLRLNATGSTTLCNGQSATLSAAVSGGTQPYQYAWSNGFTGATQIVSPGSFTNYQVQITDAHGCVTSSLNLPVMVHPPLSVTANATDSICEGATGTVHSLATGGNGGPYTYSWNGGAFTGSSAQVAPTHDSTFTVLVNDGCSTPATALVNLRVNPLPVPQFLPHLYTGCAPLSVSFNNSSVTSQGSTYHWTLGDGNYSNAQSPVHLYPNPGQYSVSLSVRSQQGCSAQLSVPNAVKVYAVPKANFSMSSNRITTQSPSVDFTDLSQHATNWYWDFGDLSSISHLQNPTHTYQDTGDYVVMLITLSAGGCADTVYRIVSMDEDFNVYIPNAFTPNFDGVNDGFIATGTGISAYEMLIYDRWGMQIYHCNSLEAPWNGLMDNTGQPCMQDVYVYKISVFDTNHKPHDFVGKVTLVR